MISETIQLKFPPELALNMQAFQSIEELNPEVGLKACEDNSVLIFEKDFKFEDIDFIELNLPEGFQISYEKCEEFGALNEIYKLEKPENEIIRIYMNNPEMISAFTALILVIVGVWVRQSKIGRFYDATARHDTTNPNDPGKVKILDPDVSFIAFKKATKEYLNKYKFIYIAPTLCIEVVSSAKDGLKQNLKKMEHEWMPAGTDIGLVVCPNSQKYFLFEKDKTGYETIDFSVSFIHSQLQGLTLDFSELLREARAENE